jgi:hypothetical protein
MYVLFGGTTFIVRESVPIPKVIGPDAELQALQAHHERKVLSDKQKLQSSFLTFDNSFVVNGYTIPPSPTPGPESADRHTTVPLWRHKVMLIAKAFTNDDTLPPHHVRPLRFQAW